MINVRFVIPIVLGTEYLRFYKEMVLDNYTPALSDTLDFNDGQNIFSSTIQCIRFQVLKNRLDVYCKQRIYMLDDQSYTQDLKILTALEFVPLD